MILKKTIIFVLGWLLLISLGWVIVYAATSYRSYTSTAVNVDEQGTCKKVTNSCSWDVFIPTNTAGEWSSFLSYKPACVGLNTCVTRVYTNTVTPNGYYLSTYDDFRLGTTDTCQKFGYDSSTGAYQCGTLVVGGSGCSPSQLNYSHNGGWGIFNMSWFDIESGTWGCNSSNGQNWCTGTQYLQWVDCVTY